MQSGSLSALRARAAGAVASIACAAAAASAPPAHAAASCPSLAPSTDSVFARTVTYPAGAVAAGSSSASLLTLVAADGSSGAATVTVEYGPTSDYGMCAVAVEAGPGRPVETTLTDLRPATTYHYRAVATSSADTTYGADQVFTTLEQGAIAQGVTLNGLDVGGRSASDAQHRVAGLVAGEVTLRLGAQRWKAARAQLGARVDVAGVVRAALAALPRQALPVRIAVDPGVLGRYLAAARARFAVAATPASVRLVGRHAVVATARSGVALDVARAHTMIAAALVSGSQRALSLPAAAVRAPAASAEKAVVVRLRSQTLTAYLGGKVVLATPVTTGRPALPTPVGSFAIVARASPYVFTSPWPPGNPYWYPPTPVTWAMRFFGNDFLHDDPGEPSSAFGTGSENGPYASHGCVHVPHDAMSFLYGWLPVGATVIVADL